MKYFISIVVTFLFVQCAIANETIDSSVKEVSNFQQLSKQMIEKNKGLLLMLHAEDCHYCELMDERILSPMVRSGEYNNRIFIRKLQIDKAELVKGFTGRVMAASDVADNYESQLTPTLLFLNHLGEDLALKLIGINSIELFGASVDEQIDELMLKIVAVK